MDYKWRKEAEGSGSLQVEGKGLEIGHRRITRLEERELEIGRGEYNIEEGDYKLEKKDWRLEVGDYSCRQGIKT